MAKRDTWIESESIENIANCLRLAADMPEGKPSDGRTFSAYDWQIIKAWLDAGTRAARDHPSRPRPLYVSPEGQVMWAKPTFSEFLSVYREQNAGTKVEGRTLRRTLERLQLRTFPSKRGRPKGKSNLF